MKIGYNNFVVLIRISITPGKNLQYHIIRIALWFIALVSSRISKFRGVYSLIRLFIYLFFLLVWIQTAVVDQRVNRLGWTTYCRTEGINKKTQILKLNCEPFYRNPNVFCGPPRLSAEIFNVRSLRAVDFIGNRCIIISLSVVWENFQWIQTNRLIFA